MLSTSKLAIWNLAMARIKAKAIASVDEPSLEARECNRVWPLILGTMLGGPHSWSFANQRVALALKVTNDRSTEWRFAYAVPANMGKAGRLIPDLAALGLTIPPIPLSGDPYRETWGVIGNFPEMPYIIEGSTIYSDVENAWFEYAIDDVEGINLGPMVTKALVLELAAATAVPVKGDSTREKELAQMTEGAWEQAIAEDRNRQPETYGDYCSESMDVREYGMKD